jgi:hypothetical protein
MIKKLLFANIIGILTFKTAISQAPCFNCGTGSSGAYLATSNTTLAGGTYDYSSFTINAGVTVTVTGTQPLTIRCTGNVIINGSLVANGGNGNNGITFSTFGTGGIGVAGGGNGGDGSYSSSVGPLPGVDGVGSGSNNNRGDGWSGGGGAGYTTNGSSSGGVGGFGGASYGNVQINPLVAGSGGGGGSGGYSCGSGGGGAGGGLIVINACGSITIASTGLISVNGGDGGSDGTGNCGGGAGGSGGSLWLAAPTVTHQGALSAAAGSGGISTLVGPPYYGVGGNGAVGRIRVDRNTFSGSGTSNPAIGYTTGVPTNALSATATSSSVLCFGDNNGTASVSPSGGVSPYTYSWVSGNYTTQSVTGLSPNTYTCYITDASGCNSTTATVIITEPTQIMISTVDDTICAGGCATITGVVTGGNPNYTYSWSNGSTTSTASPCPTTLTSYSLTVTDANGCTQTGSATVYVNALPVVTYVQNPSTFCINYPVQTLTAGSPSNGAYSGTTVVGNTFDPAAAGAGTYNIIYTFTDGDGCTNSDTSIVTVDLCTGVNSYVTSGIKMYPNPSKGLLYVELQSETMITITNVLGETVYSKLHQANNSFFDLSYLPNGVYTVMFNYNNQITPFKITIQR